MDTRVTEEFISLFPRFRREGELVAEILAHARRQAFQADFHLYWEGDSCSAIAFVLAGEVRVYRCGESGREITLYEIGPGETCILNASCILGNNAYPANAVTVSAGEMLLIPAREFRRLLGNYEAMSAFVYSLLSQRLTEVMELVQEVAFGRMDERLIEYLVEKSANGILHATHQKIANDLGTSREVVSRLLKDLERRERIVLARNVITLLTL
ncbi:cAMP-binding domain of CRP/regulatory subunit of cAMP-dependent protein kinase [Desulfuromonas soudanensis]|jgi:CRP/FNR family transcriptional regulator|uniref:cAMP-binding domain of CRP/regulatory subunit of cAMP-dependent protein kinase n=1 Tax=Desulfuromonas soudanensis TaxID=1603606 RepID=A0A0M4D6I5_9BACT|nr:Crp/Fnr family transcriptional regulator [Desulfuromonas soudanensis]ALC14917.1 cAMP-binding domain of CRP/regulatory subunit of cAMP-dependent protein kinase [Desulfuromonas soudanensis]